MCKVYAVEDTLSVVCLQQVVAQCAVKFHVIQKLVITASINGNHSASVFHFLSSCFLGTLEIT